VLVLRIPGRQVSGPDGGNRFRSTTGLSGDLLVFRASGGVRVFVDQSAQDRFSADLLCVYAGHGGGEPPGLSKGSPRAGGEHANLLRPEKPGRLIS